MNQSGFSVKKALNKKQNAAMTKFVWSFFSIAFIACFYTTFKWLHYRYSFEDSYYSHGYLVPFIIAYIVYSKRKKISTIALEENKSGLILIVLSLSMHVFGKSVNINFLSAFGMWGYIIGTTVYLGGYRLLKELAFPLAFIFFMIPLPAGLINTIGLPSKQIATIIGLEIINILNIPFYQEGFRIQLRDAVLVVGSPCNGMRSVISFVAIGTIGLFYTAASRWKWVVLLIILYPMAVVLNGIRVAALVLITEKFGIEYSSPESIWHDITGLIIFLIGMIMIVLSIRTMDRFDTPKRK